MADVTALERVWDWVTTHPDNHDQSAWGSSRNPRDQIPPPMPIRDSEPACGTTLCFAGATVVLAGYSLVWTWEKNLLAWRAYDATNEAGRVYDISALAARLLDLGGEDADDLFDATHTPSDLRAVLDEIAAREVSLALESLRLGESQPEPV